MQSNEIRPNEKISKEKISNENNQNNKDSTISPLFLLKEKSYCLDFIVFIDLFSQIFKDTFETIQIIKSGRKKKATERVLDCDSPFWYLAHLNTIYCSKLLPIINFNETNINLNNAEMYSLSITRNIRGVIKVNIEQIIENFKRIMNNIFSWIEKMENDCNEIEPNLSYCVLRMLSYHAFINEILICNSYLMQNNTVLSPIRENSEETYSSHHYKLGKLEPIFITIPTGSMCIGGKGKQNIIVTSLENQIKPVSIQQFQILNAPVTKGMFCRFMDEGGYSEEKYWSKLGWLWRRINNHTKGYKWKRINSKWKFNESFNFDPTEPIEYLSYWEAEAIANWLGGSLPTENQLEYIAKTAEIYKNDFYLRYPDKKYGIGSVWDIPEDSFGCRGIIGGVWEWCRDPIFPPDNFYNDPLWKDIDAYNIGKYCIKGGSWATIPMFIDSYSRYAREPETRCMSIGVRVVKNQMSSQKTISPKSNKISNPADRKRLLKPPKKLNIAAKPNNTIEPKNVLIIKSPLPPTNKQKSPRQNKDTFFEHNPKIPLKEEEQSELPKISSIQIKLNNSKLSPKKPNSPKTISPRSKKIITRIDNSNTPDLEFQNINDLIPTNTNIVVEKFKETLPFNEQNAKKQTQSRIQSKIPTLQQSKSPTLQKSNSTLILKSQVIPMPKRVLSIPKKYPNYLKPKKIVYNKYKV